MGVKNVKNPLQQSSYSMNPKSIAMAGLGAVVMFFVLGIGYGVGWPAAGRVAGFVGDLTGVETANGGSDNQVVV